MVTKEFWYIEGGSRAEGRSKGDRPHKQWWLPSPQVPSSGLSDSGRKKLMHQGRVIHQVLKAAKTINENVLLEMPVPTIIKDALPKVNRLDCPRTTAVLLWKTAFLYYFLFLEKTN